MTAAPSLTFPGGRKLAGWWRQLAPYSPLALWVGHLVLHQVEAQVQLAQHRPLDRFTALLLKALAVAPPKPTPRTPDPVLDALDAALHLGRPLLRQALRRLEAEGLARPAPEGRWALTDQGRQTLERNEITLFRHERRTFHFVERAGGPLSAPHFLDLRNSSGIPWPVAEGRAFDVRALEACLHQPAQWKQKYGFPLEVQEVLGLETLAPAEGRNSGVPAVWQRVILDRPEQVLAALVLAATATGGRRLLGFAVRQDGWALQSDRLLFTLDEDWAEVFPVLLQEPSPEDWRRAWQAWCEPRDLPAGEVSACALQRQGERLRVTAPAGLIERLRAARSDALKGETWLLAGEGGVRTAALVELTAAGAV
jgi:hypothetical protein